MAELIDREAKATEEVSCDGCYWKKIKRWQKCSCCRRNKKLADNYLAETWREGNG